MRVSGFSVSGVDTEKVVTDLMKLERMPLNKIEQEKQMVEWKVEAYRDVMAQVLSFRSDFFDVLNTSNYLLSESAFQNFSASSSDSSYVTATASATAIQKNNTVSVEQLATSGKSSSAQKVSKEVSGTSVADFTQAIGKSFVMQLDGSSKTITIDESIKNVEDLNALMANQVGENKVLATEENGILQFTAVAESGVHRITLFNATNGALQSLGFDEASIYSNRLSTSDTLESLSSKMSQDIFNGDEMLSFSINGVEFSFSKEEKLSSVITNINASSANVILSYNALTDRFDMRSKITGAGQTIEISQSAGDFFGGIHFLNEAQELVFEEGKDAIAYINDVKVLSASNQFNDSGVTYTFKKAHENANVDHETVNVTMDTDGVFRKISHFVTRYNELIENIHQKLMEKPNRNFRPLSEAQKESLSEKEIEKWEARAKEGLLYRDPILSSMLTDMRSSLFGNITGVSGALYSIGIKTGSYEQRGKLVIEEENLKTALSNNMENVKNIFIAGTSDSPNGDRGIARRMERIISDNIRTTRDNNGRKGLLLERAGLLGDSSATNNVLYRRLTNFNNRILSMSERLDKKEEDYYKRFSRFESTMFKMMEQSNSLMSQLGY
jgi:flagellar hook-associated protein 2